MKVVANGAAIIIVPEAGARYLMYRLQRGCKSTWLWFHGQALVIRLQPGGTNNEGPFERPARLA